MSSVDRRETGLFPGKTSLSGLVNVFDFSLLTLKKCFPSVCFVPPDAALRQQAHTRSSLTSALGPPDRTGRRSRCTRRRRAQRQRHEAPQNPVDPTVRDWFLDVMDQWRTERRWIMQQCLCEARRQCSWMFDGMKTNTLHRWKRSAPAETPRLGRRTVLSPSDMTSLSEHIMPLTDVVFLSVVTIHDPRFVARMARRRGTGRPSQQDLGQAARAWHALEPQEVRQVRERAPQP